jgi:hypothetical protein
MGEHKKGSGGNSHQRAVRAAATAVDPVPIHKVVSGAQPMQDDTKRSIYIAWGLSVAMLALSWIFGGPYWGVPLLALGTFLVLRGHLPNLFIQPWVRWICATVLLVVSLGSIWLSPLGGRWRHYEPQNKVANAHPQTNSPAPEPPKSLPPQAKSAPVPATTDNLLPYTIDDVNKIAHRIGNPYQSQHPNASRLELQAAINKELAREGYMFRVNLPRLTQNPPALFGGSKGVHLSFSGVTLVNTNPNNQMTGISTGNGSPVTMKGGGVEGFKNGIKTGNDSAVDLTDTPITAPKPSAPTESHPADKGPVAKPQ